MIWVNLPKVPQTVEMLIFVVAAYAGGSLNDVSNGKLHVMEEPESNNIACIVMERSAFLLEITLRQGFGHCLCWGLMIQNCSFLSDMSNLADVAFQRCESSMPL